MDISTRIGRIGGVTLALLMAGFAACGGDDGPSGPGGGGNGDVPESSFSAGATGDVSGSFSGTAVFAVVPEDGAESGQAFGITLADQVAGGESFGLNLFLDGDRPGSGTYAIAESEPPIAAGAGGALLSYNDGGGTAASSAISTTASGDVTITASTSSEVTGSFDVDLTLSFGDGSSGTTNVAGTFTAVGGTVTPPSF